jgi:hypothetical protein
MPIASATEIVNTSMLEGPRVNRNHPAGVIPAHPMRCQILERAGLADRGQLLPTLEGGLSQTASE